MQVRSPGSVYRVFFCMWAKVDKFFPVIFLTNPGFYIVIQLPRLAHFCCQTLIPRKQFHHRFSHLVFFGSLLAVPTYMANCTLKSTFEKIGQKLKFFRCEHLTWRNCPKLCQSTQLMRGVDCQSLSRFRELKCSPRKIYDFWPIFWTMILKPILVNRWVQPNIGQK